MAYDGTSGSGSGSVQWIETLDDLLGRLQQPWIPEDDGRRAILEAAARSLSNAAEDMSTPLPVTFICTHNSRRSHLAQVMAQVAADFFKDDGGLPITAFSGGTEATACNPRTVRALRRAGFPVVDMSGGDNPVYLLQYAENVLPMNLFSKVFDRAGNPVEKHVAVMTCDRADADCPVVPGATARISLPYVDPKAADDTPGEASVYDQRLHEIGREMFFLFRRIAEMRQAAR
jgi:arsenate reductase